MQEPTKNPKRTHEQSVKEEYKGEQNILGSQQPNGIAAGNANNGGASEEYENENPNHMIDKNSQIWWCIDCDKKYKSYPAFYTHNKIKHNGNPPTKYRIPRALDAISKDRGRPRADNNPKMKFTSEDKAQHNLEDNLFDFLGNMGSKDSCNTIIREYLKKPLDTMEIVEKVKPILLQRSNVNPIIPILEFEFGKLLKVLSEHECDEFVDPLDIDPDTQDDVSLYNIKGLFNFMRDQKMLSRYSILTIFIAWLGKELTEQAFKEIFIIAVEYFSYFSMLLDQKGNAYAKQIECRDTAAGQIKLLYEIYPFNFVLIKRYEDAKKLVEYFHTWYANYEKMISSITTIRQQVQIPQQMQQQQQQQQAQLQQFQQQQQQLQQQPMQNVPQGIRLPQQITQQQLQQQQRPIQQLPQAPIMQTLPNSNNK